MLKSREAAMRDVTVLLVLAICGNISSALKLMGHLTPEEADLTAVAGRDPYDTSKNVRVIISLPKPSHKRSKDQMQMNMNGFKYAHRTTVPDRMIMPKSYNGPSAISLDYLGLDHHSDERMDSGDFYLPYGIARRSRDDTDVDTDDDSDSSASASTSSSQEKTTKRKQKPKPKKKETNTKKYKKKHNNRYKIVHNMTKSEEEISDVSDLETKQTIISEADLIDSDDSAFHAPPPKKPKKKGRTSKKKAKEPAEEFSLYAQGNRVVDLYAPEADSDDDDDARRRLRREYFLPKRYKFDLDDGNIHKLGYFWYNGPQGQRPGPAARLPYK